MDSDLFTTVLEGGLEGAAICLLLVLTYKIYKMRVHSSSSCCGDAVKFETHNAGAGDDGLEAGIPSSIESIKSKPNRL